MKVTDITEADVTDLSSFRRKREDEKTQDINRKIEALRAEQFANIDMAVAATIDKLADKGMGHKEAAKVVYKHLGDLVMAHDIGGDFE